MPEYIDRRQAIAKLTALEVERPTATLTDAKRLLAHMPGIEILKPNGGHSQIPHWIPVTESLPNDEDGFVLVCVNGKPTRCITLEHAIELAEYDPADGWILEQYPDWTSPDVTHWMPVPEPPEEMSANHDGTSPELERMDCPVCGFETMVGTRTSDGHFHGHCETCGAKMHA